MKISLILLAGGVGNRMKSNIPKQYLLLKNKPVAIYSFDLFCSIKEIFEIIIVCEKQYEHLFYSSKKKFNFAIPGNRRQDSVFSGFTKTSTHTDLICIHDSVRPFPNPSCFKNLFNNALSFGASALSIPLISTLKKSNSDNLVTKTLKKDSLWEIQTPQALKPDILKRGFAKAFKDNITVPDDISLAELIDTRPKLTLGNRENIKITTPFDLTLANAILESGKKIQAYA